ncbi:uncharacterized protein LOC120905502 [Anopheles arabiensis]|uniref:uncharacterized protein LOC120905502 n=1 Tax=Anopheles arabiensis TaxID=7173 RepID=UPI001AADFB7A|nr:uncharacterized protein LOC120905502 [Anopheles arabiensis]
MVDGSLLAARRNNLCMRTARNTIEREAFINASPLPRADPIATRRETKWLDNRRISQHQHHPSSSFICEVIDKFHPNLARQAPRGWTPFYDQFGLSEILKKKKKPPARRHPPHVQASSSLPPSKLLRSGPIVPGIDNRVRAVSAGHFVSSACQDSTSQRMTKFDCQLRHKQAKLKVVSGPCFKVMLPKIPIR